MKQALGVVVIVVTCGLGLGAVPSGDDHPQFTAWSAAVNLGNVVNSTSYDACPTISKDGLSLFFRSNRPGGQGGFDIWVAQRDTVEDPWGAPVNLGDTINSPFDEYCTAISPDGHWMVFVSNRPGGFGSQDLYITHRKDKRDDLGWETPVNLGSPINSAYQENGPAFWADDATGRLFLYYSSARAGSLDIYVAEAINDAKDQFGSPSLVTELSLPGVSDYQPVLRKDGLEIFFVSNRPGGSGSNDLWTATRETTTDPWSPPVNLGALVNSSASDFHPTLSYDGTILIFASERTGGVGSADLWVSTRARLKGKQ